MVIRSIATRLVLTVASIYSVVTLLSLQGQISRAEAERDELSKQTAAAEAEVQGLEARLAGLDGKSLQELARSELGLVTRGELIFYDSSN